MFGVWRPHCDLWSVQDALGYFGTCSGSWCPTRARRSTPPSPMRSAVTLRIASVKPPNWWARWRRVLHLDQMIGCNSSAEYVRLILRLYLYRNTRPPGGSSSPPCPSMQSLWPTSAGAGPSTCCSSASRPTLKKSLALRSARWHHMIYKNITEAPVGFKLIKWKKDNRSSYGWVLFDERCLGIIGRVPDAKRLSQVMWACVIVFIYWYSHV